jgi:hypothetical protein
LWNNRSQIQARLTAIKEKYASSQTQLEELQSELAKERESRPTSVCAQIYSDLITDMSICRFLSKESRTQALERLATLKAEDANLDEELKAYGACDPAKLEELKRAITLAKEAAFRWTGMFHAYWIISLLGRDRSSLSQITLEFCLATLCVNITFLRKTFANIWRLEKITKIWNDHHRS